MLRFSPTTLRDSPDFQIVPELFSSVVRSRSSRGVFSSWHLVRRTPWAATGTRTEHTIPAGRMGNEQPINVTSEQWGSEELGVTVSSTLHDPIIGDTQFHLSQIERSEPDPTLFVVPSDYALTDVTASQAVIIQR